MPLPELFTSKELEIDGVRKVEAWKCVRHMGSALGRPVLRGGRL